MRRPYACSDAGVRARREHNVQHDDRGQGPHAHLQVARQVDRGGARHRPDGQQGRDRRLSRAQRRRQDDDAEDAVHAARRRPAAARRWRAATSGPTRSMCGARSAMSARPARPRRKPWSAKRSSATRSSTASTGRRRRRVARDLLAALDLADVWDRTCGSLSGGQRRRLDIVMGLIHEPKLVFLDEPSTGLDPQSRANLWNHIRCAARQDGHHGIPDHPLHGRSGFAQRSDPDHRPRHDRRRGHASRAQEARFG